MQPPWPGLALALALALLVTLLPGAGAAHAQVPCLTPTEAIASLGQPACVEGVVTNVFYARRSNGQPTFMDMGTQFTAVIWGEDRAAFDPPPETRRGQRIRVVGIISEYRGKAQIIVREPSQIGPTGGPPPQLTPAQTRVSTATNAGGVAATAGVIPTSVETPAPPASATVEAITDDRSAVPGVASSGSPVSFPSTRETLPAASVTLAGPAAGRSRVDTVQARGGPAWMLVAGGLSLIAAGAGGALMLTRRRDR